MIGSKLGPYEILEQLGVGGMGEVWLAEDARLGRKVAIKVLPAEFAYDPERLARFEQEARAAAALNHPHIAVVHDVGSETDEDGKPTHFMVQEHLEGDSLRARLQADDLPLEKALDLAIEIAEALTAAHGAGIVHRDLKPDNIFVSAGGHAKVLDFGLAKLIAGAAPRGADLSLSPTMLGTVAGQIMGTAGYMAPEQVNGATDIDQRADLFAFGCVLYEMSTRTRAFGAATALDTLHKIVHSEPQSLTDLRPDLPAEMQRILRKCLAKDRDRRYQSAEDIVVDLRQLRDDVAAGVAPSAAEGTGRPGAPVTVGWSTAALVASIIVTAAVAGTAAWFTLRPETAPPAPLADFDVPLPEGVRFTNGGRRLVAFSPDGTRIVFVADRQLHVRRLGETEITPLRGTEAGYVMSPFFSPDGRHVAFFADGELRRVEATGGPPQTLAAFEGVGFHGATWASDGFIYLATLDAALGSSIWRVSENGGEARNIITFKGEVARAPQLLPGDDWLLFTVVGMGDMWNDAATVVQSLRTGERRELFRGGTDARYLPTGHIVYARDYTLYGRTFDPARLQVGSASVPVREGVLQENFTARQHSGTAQWATSDVGGLVYRPGTTEGSGGGMTWYAADGRAEPVPLPPVDGSLYEPRLSPAADRIAARVVTDEASQIVVYDIDQRNLQLFAPRGEGPEWAPDGEWLYYSDDSGGDLDIFRGRVASSLAPEPLLVREGDQMVTDVATDRLLFTQRDAGGDNGSIWTLSLEGGGAEPALVVGGSANMSGAVFSPDGRWIAHHSNETGRTEVWAQEYPGPGAKLKISGGESAQDPQWIEAGVFYQAFQYWTFVEDRDPGPGFDPAPPRIVGANMMRTRGHRNYDVSPDGLRLLLPRAESEAGPSSSQTLRVVLNWFDELTRKLPPTR